jgi:hypothetical protein
MTIVEITGGMLRAARSLTGLSQPIWLAPAGGSAAADAGKESVRPPARS